MKVVREGVRREGVREGELTYVKWQRIMFSPINNVCFVFKYLSVVQISSIQKVIKGQI